MELDYQMTARLECLRYATNFYCSGAASGMHRDTKSVLDLARAFHVFLNEGGAVGKTTLQFERWNDDGRTTQFAGRLLDAQGRFISLVGETLAKEIVNAVNAAAARPEQRSTKGV